MTQRVGLSKIPERRAGEPVVKSAPSANQSAISFNDNRPYAQEQQSVQRMAANSHRVQQQQAVQLMVNASQPVQRATDKDGNISFPPAERVNLDAMMAANDIDPNNFSVADYTHLQGLHAALVAAVVADADYDVSDDYYAILNYSEDHSLEAGGPEWNTAVEAGADHYEAAAPAARTYQASAQATWPGRAAMPAAFTQAITAKVAQRVAQRAAAIQAEYQAYQNNGRLLPGTINAIRLNLGGGADLATVQARLALVYGRQCTITRQNWLQHLGIAGQAINGTANLHFTTFNDAVTTPAGLRVDQNTANQLCDALFTGVGAEARLHATLVVGVNRYHKYWGGVYSANQGGMSVAERGQLDGEYNRMVAHIRALVTTAKNNHGRVSDNANGQQNDVGP